jgi:rfaE bifunctional protein kinase chain/domain
MTVSEILNAFPGMAALVIGDICLDRWCTYDPGLAEPSRETGIPRTGVVKSEITPGAGGTVANNLAALGVGRVAVLGAIGNDGFGAELKHALVQRGIEPELLVSSPAIQTFTYTKLLNSRTGAEDLPRIDFVNSGPVPSDIEEQVLTKLRFAAGAFDAILVSDQAETEQGGVVTAAVRDMLRDIADRYDDKVVWADSRMRPELFRNVIVKPNQEEAESACRRVFGKVDFEKLRKHIDTELLLVTHGSQGVLVLEKGKQTWVRTRFVANPVDICGAGDSFSAGAAMALAVDGSPVEAARIGNLVASVTIGKKGTGTATPEEVLLMDRVTPV